MRPRHFYEEAATFACAGKERYVTKGRAVETIRRRQRRAKRSYTGRKGNDDERRELANLTAYRCDFCHNWHVGSDHGLK